MSDVSNSELTKLVVLFEPNYTYSGSKCIGADNDVAGIGVVTAFTVTAGITAILSVCAAILDGMSEAGGVLPDSLNDFIKRKSPRQVKEKRGEYRQVLDRTMLTLADQQLLTGLAILISGYIRATQDEIFNLEDGEYLYTWRLTENHFHLIIYLSCLSSSAHLACLISLEKYFHALSFPARVRLILIVLFALLLAPSVFLSAPFGFNALLVKIELKTLDPNPDKTSAYVVLYYFLRSLSLVLVLYPFAIAIINIFGNLRRKIQERLRRLWHTERRWLPTFWVRADYHFLRGGPCHKGSAWSKIEDWTKSSIWAALTGSARSAFFMQLFFFLVSLAFVLAQKAANTPKHLQGEWCDLSSSGTGRWGFGQILPMILLGQPVLAAVVEYCNVFHPTPIPDASSIRQTSSERLLASGADEAAELEQLGPPWTQDSESGAR